MFVPHMHSCTLMISLYSALLSFPPSPFILYYNLFFASEDNSQRFLHPFVTKINEISEKSTPNHPPSLSGNTLIVFRRVPCLNDHLPLPTLLKLESSNRGRGQTLKLCPGKRIPHTLPRHWWRCEKPIVTLNSSRPILSAWPPLRPELLRTSAP